ncbi:hypothetical protein K8R03_02805 [Candidatus Kaiserbacteria bacterium]|nr:hypothetical protein [Candidatus Kaiserbacteria bacterium]
MTDKKYIVGGLAALAIIMSVFAFWSLRSVGTGSLEARANAIVTTCKTQTDPSACYEKEVPALYPGVAVPQLFDIIRIIRQKDPSYQFCHVLAHKIGEKVVAEDPNRWVDAIPMNPTDGLCSNGYIHGVVGGRFRAEVLDDSTLQKFLPDFRRACEPHNGWNPSNLDKAMCYHGMGHLYDFITNADLKKALALCEETTSDDFHRVCREGVFMQIYQPLEPDDYALIAQMPVKPTADTVRQFCAAFRSNPAYEGACLRESWPLHAGMTDGTGVESFCSGQPNAEEETACYQSATAIIGRMSLGDPAKAADACGKLPSERQDLCFKTTAQAVLEENRNDASKAISLCARAPGSIARNCMETLTMQAPFIFGQNSDELQRFCAALPADMRSQCGRSSQPR